MNNISDTIKRTLSMDEVVRAYGFEPNRAGYIKCPFHADKTASLRVYKEPGRGFHCFGCGAGSTVIDFVMRLFDISFPAAVVRLNADFHLGLTAARPDPREIEQRRRELEKRSRAARFNAAEQRVLSAQHRWTWAALRETDPFSDDWCRAAKNINELEYRLDELMEVTRH